MLKGNGRIIQGLRLSQRHGTAPRDTRPIETPDTFLYKHMTVPNREYAQRLGPTDTGVGRDCWLIILGCWTPHPGIKYPLLILNHSPSPSLNSHTPFHILNLFFTLPCTTFSDSIRQETEMDRVAIKSYQYVDQYVFIQNRTKDPTKRYQPYITSIRLECP